MGNSGIVWALQNRKTQYTNNTIMRSTVILFCKLQSIFNYQEGFRGCYNITYSTYYFLDKHLHR
jgi:hypothetical protein